MRMGARIRGAMLVAALVCLALCSASLTISGPVTSRDATASAGTASESGRGASVGTAIRLSFRLPELNGARFTPNARDIAVRSISTGPLLLFLPATGAVPRDYSAFLDTASSLGYHVLALDYWNLGLSVARTCGTDPVCYGDVVANRFDGSHAGIHSSVASNDSIVTRLTHALTVLHARDPAGGWERYLSGGRVRWNRLVLAGHSQGGGEAAYIAHRHRVQGVLMFASPVASDGTVVATWLSDRGATSIDRYYGLDDVHDVYLRRIEGSWAAMGLSGAEQSVAVNSGLPFVGGHRMLSNAELGTARQAHGRIVDDNGPRTKAGSPLFQPIWQWMLKAVRAPTASEHRPRTVS